MKILYIGAGFVGACSAAISANSGHDTLVFDIDETRVNAFSSFDRDTIEDCLFEEGLGDMLVRNQSRIKFTTNYQDVEGFLDVADAVFLCLPTPEKAETGESDLSYYFVALEDLIRALKQRNGGTQEKYIAVINRSTVPVGTVQQTVDLFKKAEVKNVGVLSNPEFLVEGKAVRDSLKPDRIVIGASSEKDFEVMRQVYQRFYDAPGVTCLEVTPSEAAAGKLLANFYLYAKLQLCFDVVGRASEVFEDVRFENLRKIITSDARIGSWGFYDSLYAGGSCLIKDARSLSHQLQTRGQSAPLIDEVHAANVRQLELFLGRAVRELNFDWAGKKIALLGLTFKRDTNDVRNSGSIEVMNFLKKQQVSEIKLYDPFGKNNFMKLFPANDVISYYDHEFEAVQDVDVIIVATDWPQFRGLADVIIGELDKKPLIMDGRRMLQHRYDDLQKAGFTIVGVGSPTIKNNAL